MLQCTSTIAAGIRMLSLVLMSPVLPIHISGNKTAFILLGSERPVYLSNLFSLRSMLHPKHVRSGKRSELLLTVLQRASLRPLLMCSISSICMSCDISFWHFVLCVHVRWRVHSTAKQICVYHHLSSTVSTQSTTYRVCLADTTKDVDGAMISTFSVHLHLEVLILNLIFYLSIFPSSIGHLGVHPNQIPLKRKRIINWP